MLTERLNKRRSLIILIFLLCPVTSLYPTLWLQDLPPVDSAAAVHHGICSNMLPPGVELNTNEFCLWSVAALRRAADSLMSRQLIKTNVVLTTPRYKEHLKTSVRTTCRNAVM